MKFKYKNLVVVNNGFYVDLRGVIREVDDVNNINPKYLVYLFDGERIWIEEKYISLLIKEQTQKGADPKLISYVDKF